jgi:hypothetical protein
MKTFDLRLSGVNEMTFEEQKVISGGLMSVVYGPAFEIIKNIFALLGAGLILEDAINGVKDGWNSVE